MIISSTEWNISKWLSYDFFCEKFLPIKYLKDELKALFIMILSWYGGYSKGNVIC